MCRAGSISSLRPIARLLWRKLESSLIAATSMSFPFPPQRCHLDLNCPTDSISTCPNRSECRRVALAMTNGQQRYYQGWTLEVSNSDYLWGLRLYTPAEEMDSHQYWEVESIEDAFASAQLYIDSLSESTEK